MEENQIFKLISDLYLSLIDNNLEKTKEIIIQLNQICKEDYSIINYNILNGYNPMTDVSSFDISNQAYDYAINNLENIKIKERLQWYRKMYVLNISKNKEEIIDLINAFIYDDIKLNNFIQSIGFDRIKLDLMKLSFLIKDYNLLKELNNKTQKE